MLSKMMSGKRSDVEEVGAAQVGVAEADARVDRRGLDRHAIRAVARSRGSTTTSPRKWWKRPSAFMRRDVALNPSSLVSVWMA